MASSSQPNFATAKAIISAVGSIAASAMVVRSVVSGILPPELHDHIFSGIQNFFSRFSNQLTLVVDEFDGLLRNEIYDSAQIYLGPRTGPKTRRLKISKPEKEEHYKITTERDQEIVDTYENEKFKWVFFSRPNETRNRRDETQDSIFPSENRSFELTFHKRNKDLVLNSYLPHIKTVAKDKKQEKKTVKILTIGNIYSTNNVWESVTLDHPATFDTLAMDSDQKEMILEDLAMFVRRRDYYRKVGKAWKRGYLLYGPPGTGKSSLIAAMANYFKFDVYDLELTDLNRNDELRKLLVNTANKSILVVEDIDRTIDFQYRDRRGNVVPNERQVTLSGLLNFVDGLWSSCGDERIIIFTTNHVEKLDPALLRPGRMDLHINMSYCSFCGFKLLASNYLGIDNDHIHYEEIEKSIGIAKVTPAEVAEQLLKNDDPSVSLRGLIDFIHKKIQENEEAEADRKAKAESDESWEKLQKRKNNEIEELFTLSGLLNFIDGLWSSCGDERIIVFTTNNKDKLDPALLRPGRMDMHIHMSYLTPEAFKLLAATYLSVIDLRHDQRVSEIEDLIKVLKITPAEIAEELMKSDDTDTCLDGMLDFLKCKNENGVVVNDKEIKDACF